VIIQEVYIRIGSQNKKAKIMVFNDNDRVIFRRIYSNWLRLRQQYKIFHSRAPNFPEIVSEGLFCLDMGAARVISINKAKKCDTIDLTNHRRQQIKAFSGLVDLTSFGPSSIYDDFYFMDFYRGGNFNGKYAIYKIPNNLISVAQVNRSQTLSQQQRQQRRPHISLVNRIIKPNRIRPIIVNKI